jgi:SAM-dependent methyltransferase
MIHKTTMPSIRAAIIPVRENVRDLVNKVQEGDYAHFLYDRAEDPSQYRHIIEEFGLTFQESRPGELVFKRPGRAERWEYAFPLIGLDPSVFPASWKCLDVGCGRRPWPRANWIMDTNPNNAKHAMENQQFFTGSITGRTPFQDKEFDFVTCFHVLEHVSDPVAAAKEISRIGKQGLVEVPHPCKEGMFLFHESDHRWMIMPGTDRLFFFSINAEWWKQVQDPEAQGAIARKYIGTMANVGDDAILRNYFTRVEAYTNIIHRWQGELKVEIMS